VSVQYLECSLLWLVTPASDLPMRKILFCCLRRNIESSCHKQDSLIHGASSSVSRNQQTPPLQCYQRWVTNLQRPGGTVFIAPDGRTVDDTRRSEILVENSDFFFQTSPAFNAPVMGVPSDYCHNFWQGKN